MFAYSMQLVSDCYNVGLITVKSILSSKNADVIQRPLTALSGIEINPRTPVTDCVREFPSGTPQLLQDFIQIT